MTTNSKQTLIELTYQVDQLLPSLRGISGRSIIADGNAPLVAEEGYPGDGSTHAIREKLKPLAAALVQSDTAHVCCAAARRNSHWTEHIQPVHTTAELAMLSRTDSSAQLKDAVQCNVIREIWSWGCCRDGMRNTASQSAKLGDSS